MKYKFNAIWIASSIVILIIGTNLALAQQRVAQTPLADQQSCGKQPKHEAGTPKITNFCECLPKGLLLADPASISGQVDIRFEVGADGTLIGVGVLHSSGYRNLDRLVLHAVPKCRFEPADKDGKPVKSFLVQRYIFEDDYSFGEHGEGLRVENVSVK